MVESGPLSESEKDEPVNWIRVLAHVWNFWRSVRVVVNVGGLRNSGVLGVISEMGLQEIEKHEMGFGLIERLSVLDTNVVDRDEARAKFVRFISSIDVCVSHVCICLPKTKELLCKFLIFYKY